MWGDEPLCTATPASTLSSLTSDLLYAADSLIEMFTYTCVELCGWTVGANLALNEAEPAKLSLTLSLLRTGHLRVL